MSGNHWCGAKRVVKSEMRLCEKKKKEDERMRSQSEKKKEKRRREEGKTKTDKKTTTVSSRESHHNLRPARESDRGKDRHSFGTRSVCLPFLIQRKSR